MNATVALFQRSWQRAWQGLGLPADELAMQQVLQAYAEPHRHYHTQQHLAECLTLLEPLLSQASHPAEVELALWFHDAVYDVRASDNEWQSALWVQRLVGSAVAPEVSTRIVALVLATRHSQTPQSCDEQLLVDVDLAILGAEPARFDEYERQVRAEYAHVPEAQFRTRRAAILRGFLQWPRLYGTPELQARHEARALANLQRSLGELT